MDLNNINNNKTAQNSKPSNVEFPNLSNHGLVVGDVTDITFAKESINNNVMNNKKRKIIIVCVVGVLICLFICVALLVLFLKNNNTNQSTNSNTAAKTSTSKVVDSKAAYDVFDDLKSQYVNIVPMPAYSIEKPIIYDKCKETSNLEKCEMTVEFIDYYNYSPSKGSNDADKRFIAMFDLFSKDGWNFTDMLTNKVLHDSYSVNISANPTIISANKTYSSGATGAVMLKLGNDRITLTLGAYNYTQ